MSGWSDISNDFLKYLKAESKQGSKIDSKELEKMSASSAVVKYENEFNKWLNQKGIDEKDLQKNAIDIDSEDNENFFDEMLNDYISDLDKDDKVFKSIDKNSDGEISKSEKKEYLSYAKNLDNNAENISIKDISLADKSIRSQGISSQSAPVSSAPVYPSQETASIDNTASIDSDITTTQVENTDEGIELTKDVNLDVTSAQDIDAQLEIAQQNKQQCASIISGLDEQSANIENDYQKSTSDLDKLTNDIAKSDENVAKHQDILNTLQKQSDDAQTALKNYISEKDGIMSSLNSINAQISQYGDEVPQDLEVQKENLESQLKEKIAQIQRQEQLNEIYANNLTDAQMNLMQAIVENKNLNKEKKEEAVESAKRASNLTLFNTLRQNAQAELSVAESQEEVLLSKKTQQ